MTAAAIKEIDRIRQQEQLAIFARNEAAMLEKLVPVPRPDLGPHNEFLAPFIEWCAKRSVRSCPCKPAVLATYLTECKYRGEEFAIHTVEAVQAAHDYYNFATPTSTPLINRALADIITSDPPRSWPKEEKLLFATLPPWVKRIVVKRQADCDREVRRSQNEAADLRKKLNGQSEKAAEKNGAGNNSEQSSAISG